jgi:hypothetical protein
MGCNRRGFGPDSLELWSAIGPIQPPRVWAAHLFVTSLLLPGDSNPTGSTRCAGGDYTTSTDHSCAGLATPAKAVSGLNRRTSTPDSSTLGSRVKRSSTHHLKAVAQNRHPVFQPTLVRGAASRPLPRCWSSHAKCPRLPMFNRAAIQAKGMVVLERNSRANRTFPGRTTD